MGTNSVKSVDTVKTMTFANATFWQKLGIFFPLLGLYILFRGLAVVAGDAKPTNGLFSEPSIYLRISQ